MESVYPRPGIRLPARLAFLPCLLLVVFSAVDAAAQCAAPVFPGAAEYAAGSHPAAVATGDFNGDGATDLAAANLVSDDVSILLGDGVGGFGPPKNLAVPPDPGGVAVSDFNKDGKADLAVAHGGGPVTVLFGDGGGNFSQPTVVANGLNPVAVAVGDFNSDGNPDFVVATRGSNQLILLGDGVGGFALRNLSTPGSSTSVAVADFNGDGRADVAFSRDTIATPSGWGVQHYLGGGDGNFSAGVFTQFGQSPRGLAVADFNGDGRPDLAVVGEYSAPRLGILLNDGSGGFNSSTNIWAGPSPSALATGDFDADGKADVAVVLTRANNVMVALGNGLGGIAAVRHYGTGDGPLALTTGDFNADGKTDLATANRERENFQPGFGNVSVLLGVGGGAFNTYRAYVFPDTPTHFLSLAALAAGDFNNNGRPDLVTSFQFVTGIYLMLDDGAGNFIQPSAFNFHGNNPSSLTVADFNGDNNADLAYTNDKSGIFDNVGIVSVHIGNGAGIFPDLKQVPVNPRPTFVTHGDFNGDGKRDLIVTHEEAAAVILLGNGAGGFSQPPGGPLPALRQLAVADFNGDGRSDVVAANFPQNSLTVLTSDASGRLTAVSSTPLPFPNSRVTPAAADMNLDGRADVVTANANGNSVSVFLGDGAGGLAAPSSFAVGVSPMGITVADFNGDGKPDVVTANNGGSLNTGDLSLLPGDGAGGFGPAQKYLAGQNPFGLLHEDFNLDGKIDLAVMSASLSVLPNISSSLPCLSVNDVTLEEGDAGQLGADFTVSLSSPAAETVRVNYSLAGTSASPGADFTPVAGRLVFAPGETSKTVSVPVPGDALDEENETFKVSLKSPSGAALGDGEGLGTIVDNDATPTLSVNDITVVEGGVTLTRNFTVTLSAPSGRPVTVRYSAADGTATAGAQSEGHDYFLFQPPITLTIPAGQTSVQAGVHVHGDNTFEPDETFFVNLDSPTNATIEDGQGQATIQNDDPVPTIAINGNSILEGNNGTQQSPGVSIFLSNPTSLPVTINYATADDTASAGADYVAASGSVTLNPRETNKVIPVQIIGDEIDEVTERFIVNVSNVQNAVAPSAGALVFIQDDDGPTISVDDISIDEGQGGLTGAVFTLTLSAASVQNVTVRVTTSPGTATAASDFTPINFNVTIPAGTLSRTVTVSVVGDTTAEPDETFFVNLTNPGNASIAKAQGTGVIKNDDAFSGASVQVSNVSLTAAEGDGSVLVKVTRTGDITGTSSVSFATANGTATDTSDYTAAYGTLTFAPNEAEKNILLFITNDRYLETPETLTITLSNPTGAILGANQQTTITINSEDTANGQSPVRGGPDFDPSFFVRQHYRDFLNRDPDAAGLNFWAGQTTNCGNADLLVCRINVSAAFFLSPEFQDTGFYVIRMQRVAAGRRSDFPRPVAGGRMTLADFLRDARQVGEGFVGGQPGSEQVLEANRQVYATRVATSAEFIANFPTTLSPEAYVDALFAKAGVAPTAVEKQAAVNAYGAAGGGTAGRVAALRSVAESSSVREAEFRTAFVLMQYFGYMRRDPDQLGYNFWLGKLNEFNGDYVAAEMVKAFITSGEYIERFGQ